MRSDITEISYSIAFGASAMIFISALLILLLRESPSPAGKGGAVVNEPSNVHRKTVQEPGHTQSPVIVDGLQPSTTQLQDETKQNQSNRLTESTEQSGASGLLSRDAPNETAIDQNQDESSAVHSLQTSPEPAIPQINEKSSRPANSVVAEEKRSAQHEPMSILVLGEGSFSPGQVTPGANMQAAIDKIIPLIKARPLDNVVVEGHADKGIRDGVSPAQASKWNKIVSLRRASAVAKLLERKGVASDRIIVNGLGDAVPLVSNHSREGRAKNRRVEIKLSPTQ